MDHPLDLATVPSSVHLIGRACAAALCSRHSVCGPWLHGISSLLHAMCFCASLKGRGNPYAVLTSVQTTQRPHLYLTTGHMFLRFVQARHGQMRKRRRNPAHARGANTQSAQEDESEIPPLRAAAALGCRLVAEGGLRLPPPPLRSRARADPRRTAT